MTNFLHMENLTFTYENCIEPLFDDISFQIDEGWTAIVGVNGSGKTTLLKLVCGLLKPDTGILVIPGKTHYTEQRTDFMPAEFHDFFNSTQNLSYKIKRSLHIVDDWQNSWDTLSHGERKRIQIGVALNVEPMVLAVDEPSNHLDSKSKNILLNALKSFRGIGLLVSHDRDLMDNLCQRTIFLNPPQIDVRKCSYSIAASEIEREHKSRAAEYLLAKREVKKLKKKVNVQKEKANKAAKLRSKSNLDNKDHDAKAKKDLARLTGKDGFEGRKLKRFKTKLDSAQAHKDSIKFQKISLHGIVFNTEEGRNIFPIIIPSSIKTMGKEKLLKIPELSIVYGDKIGIIGNNGSGKSTFLNHLMKISNIPGDRVIYIPQEISSDQSVSMLKRIRSYSREKKGQIMTILSRLGSDPINVLETTIPSPGEIRKLMLAEGIMLNPSLIIMDEPTNHMDLTSIECIEEALNECSCAQLLVSHDIKFLKNTVKYFWEFSRNSKYEYTIKRIYQISV